MTILRCSQLVTILALSVLSSACSGDSGEKGNLAGSDSGGPEGQAGAPNDKEKPGEKDEDELDAQCDPEAEPFGGGEGTEKSPFLLCSPQQVQAIQGFIASDLSTKAEHFQLTRSLSLENVSLIPIGYDTEDLDSEAWGPIFAYQGTFDGRGHTLSDVRIHQDEYGEVEPKLLSLDSVGFFSRLGGEGRILNLKLDKLSVYSVVNNSVGGLAGHSSGLISHVQVEGKVRTIGEMDGPYMTKKSLGGLVGLLIGGEIKDSSFSGEVAGLIMEVGAICGSMETQGVLERVSSSGTVSGFSSVGGLVGAARGLYLIDSTSSSTVTGDYNAVGGLLGASSSSVLLRSEASGDVQGGNQTGGLVGFSSSSTFSFVKASGKVEGKNAVGGAIGHSGWDTWRFSSASGDVSGTYEVGGFAGYYEIGVLSSVWSSGKVEGELEVGGLVGNLTDSGEVINSYSLGDVVGSSSVGGLIGRKGSYSVGPKWSYALGRLSSLVEGEEIKRGGGLVGSAEYSDGVEDSFFFDERFDNEVGTPLTQKEFGQKESWTNWTWEEAWQLDPAAKPFARPVLKY